MEKKPAWERVVLFLFPTIELEATLWQNLWTEERRQLFRFKMRVFLLIAAVIYAAHFFLVDLPAQVEPIRLWMAYRFGLAASFLVAYVITYTRFFENSRFYWLPFYGVAVAACYLQALSITWDERVPYFFAIALPVIIVSVYGFSLVPSLLFIASIFVVQWEPLNMALASDAEGTRLIISSYLAGIVCVMGARSNYAKDVSGFIKRQQLILERQKVIEGQKDLTNQLKGFLPSEIFTRIIIYNRKHRMTMTQATDEVIRPRKKMVACIHSDIRSFTRNSKDVDLYLLDRAIPNIRLMTEISESRRGISRLIGDLILSYFDQDNPTLSLLLAMDCGIEISEKNNRFNSASSDARGILRNVIISYGTCIVGNIGAADHAREITPLGPPVNLISRIDSLIKTDHEKFNIDLNNTLILTLQAAQSLTEVIPEIDIHYHDLKPLSLVIKDFPEEETLASIRCTEHLKKLVRTKLAEFDADLKKTDGIFQEFEYDSAI